MPLDPLIINRYADRVQMTDFIVKLQTVTPRRWTPLAGGITVDAESYSPLAVAIGSFLESGDGSSRVSVTLSIPNGDQAQNDLVFNLANRRKAVTIRKLHFDPATREMAGAEPWFVGQIAKVTGRGALLEIVCSAHSGRRGLTPSITFRDVMPNRLAPDGNDRLVFG